MRILVVVILFLSGCGTVGRIALPGVKVQGVKDAGTPATIAKSDAGVSVPLPEGSRLIKTEYAALPATEKEPAQPAKTVTEIIPGGASQYTETKASIRAETGTVDTSVRKHEIDVQDRSKLLWVAIACGVAGIVARSLVPAWPAISNGLLGAAAVAGLAWKVAEIPAWLFLVVIGLAALMVATYKRAEWDKDGNNVPDFLEGKK
jgi:hypothetical protein